MVSLENFPGRPATPRKPDWPQRSPCIWKTTTLNRTSSFSQLACIRRKSRENTRDIINKTMMAYCSIIYSFYISITKTYVQYVKETFCGYNFAGQTNQPDIQPCKTLNREHDNSGGKLKRKLKPIRDKGKLLQGLFVPHLTPLCPSTRRTPWKTPWRCEESDGTTPPSS